MAQIVGYFQDYVSYTHGPFVMVHIGGWRIECEMKDHHCPVLCHPSIYQILQSEKLYQGKTNNKNQVAYAVDWLNDRVKDGTITLKGKIWVF